VLGAPAVVVSPVLIVLLAIAVGACAWLLANVFHRELAAARTFGVCIGLAFAIFLYLLAAACVAAIRA